MAWMVVLALVLTLMLLELKSFEGVTLTTIMSGRKEAATWQNLTTDELESMRHLAREFPPIVVEEYKLVFFAQHKVASTQFKKLFRRMMHIDDWDAEPTVLHNRKANNLTYIDYIPEDRWHRIMTGSDWTRAIFVRDPKERLLSAYLDKIVNQMQRDDRHKWEYIFMCCRVRDENDECVKQGTASFEGFATIVRDKCLSRVQYWKPQSQRMDPNLWKFVDFVGHLNDTAATKQLLNQLTPKNAWNSYGKSGWGGSGRESILQKTSSVASELFDTYFNTTTIHQLVEEMYFDDFNKK
eukprot:CAMPEP_0119555478 /NCGR_PEP_ID=MMETSP1352-20130426/7672_1 /TAXON_ID=265584 /ORGANISM="Stauroneis constricta, Strain CCMP1120" /LENGTH=295 /DNA_ID=CAMNT_0007602241 /DNA_START=74 /DNA_END=961 /DNA_ORIENTATION=-